jgi:hypothetical protein
MSIRLHTLGLACVLATALASSGCLHFGGCRTACDPCGAGACDPCGSCDPCGGGRFGGCRTGCGGCGCGMFGGLYQGTANHLENADLKLCGAVYRRSNAIPDTLPLGSTVRAWYQVMETNGEAVDFIINRKDFVGETARLTPDGRDHVYEIAARMRSAPFPVIVERSENNSNPELDALRRQVIVSILTNFGNADADQRTVVSPSYGPGYTSSEAESNYGRYLSNGGGFGTFGTFGNNAGQFGGFGGGGGGGLGFGP